MTFEEAVSVIEQGMPPLSTKDQKAIKALRAELDRQREFRHWVNEKMKRAKQDEANPPGSLHPDYYNGAWNAYQDVLLLFDQTWPKPAPTYEHDPHFWRRG